jgi:hypothetical protein
MSYADDLGSAVHYALETTRAIAVCPFHLDLTIRIGDDAAESHAFARARKLVKSDGTTWQGEALRKEFGRQLSKAADRYCPHCAAPTWTGIDSNTRRIEQRHREPRDRTNTTGTGRTQQAPHQERQATAVGRPYSAPKTEGHRNTGQAAPAHTGAYRGPAGSGRPSVGLAEMEKCLYSRALPPFSTGRKSI